jgi:hypothetical protein
MRVTWARTNGRPLPRRASIDADNSLTINGLISSDGGGYTCTAVNTYGRTEGTVLLKVMGESADEQPKRGDISLLMPSCCGW